MIMHLLATLKFVKMNEPLSNLQPGNPILYVKQYDERVADTLEDNSNVFKHVHKSEKGTFSDCGYESVSSQSKAVDTTFEDENLVVEDECRTKPVSLGSQKSERHMYDYEEHLRHIVDSFVEKFDIEKVLIQLDENEKTIVLELYAINQIQINIFLMKVAPFQIDFKIGLIHSNKRYYLILSNTSLPKECIVTSPQTQQEPNCYEAIDWDYEIEDTSAPNMFDFESHWYYSFNTKNQSAAETSQFITELNNIKITRSDEKQTNDCKMQTDKRDSGFFVLTEKKITMYANDSYLYHSNGSLEKEDSDTVYCQSLKSAESISDDDRHLSNKKTYRTEVFIPIGTGDIDNAQTCQQKSAYNVADAEIKENDGKMKNKPVIARIRPFEQITDIQNDDKPTEPVFDSIEEQPIEEKLKKEHKVSKLAAFFENCIASSLSKPPIVKPTLRRIASTKKAIVNATNSISNNHEADQAKDSIIDINDTCVKTMNASDIIQKFEKQEHHFIDENKIVDTIHDTIQKLKSASNFAHNDQRPIVPNSIENTFEDKTERDVSMINKSTLTDFPTEICENEKFESDDTVFDERENDIQNFHDILDESENSVESVISNHASVEVKDTNEDCVSSSVNEKSCNASVSLTATNALYELDTNIESTEEADDMSCISDEADCDQKSDSSENSTNKPFSNILKAHLNYDDICGSDSDISEIDCEPIVVEPFSSHSNSSNDDSDESVTEEKSFKLKKVYENLRRSISECFFDQTKSCDNESKVEINEIDENEQVHYVNQIDEPVQETIIDKSQTYSICDNSHRKKLNTVYEETSSDFSTSSYMHEKDKRIDIETSYPEDKAFFDRYFNFESENTRNVTSDNVQDEQIPVIEEVNQTASNDEIFSTKRNVDALPYDECSSFEFDSLENDSLLYTTPPDDLSLDQTVIPDEDIEEYCFQSLYSKKNQSKTDACNDSAQQESVVKNLSLPKEKIELPLHLQKRLVMLNNKKQKAIESKKSDSRNSGAIPTILQRNKIPLRKELAKPKLSKPDNKRAKSSLSTKPVKINNKKKTLEKEVVCKKAPIGSNKGRVLNQKSSATTVQDKNKTTREISQKVKPKTQEKKQPVKISNSEIKISDQKEPWKNFAKQKRDIASCQEYIKKSKCNLPVKNNNICDDDLAFTGANDLNMYSQDVKNLCTDLVHQDIAKIYDGLKSQSYKQKDQVVSCKTTKSHERTPQHIDKQKQMGDTYTYLTKTEDFERAIEDSSSLLDVESLNCEFDSLSNFSFDAMEKYNSTNKRDKYLAKAIEDAEQSLSGSLGNKSYKNVQSANNNCKEQSDANDRSKNDTFCLRKDKKVSANHKSCQQTNEYKKESTKNVSRTTGLNSLANEKGCCSVKSENQSKSLSNHQCNSSEIERSYTCSYRPCRELKEVANMRKQGDTFNSAYRRYLLNKKQYKPFSESLRA